MTHLMRKIRVALSPRSSLLKSTLANGAVVYGRNRPGYGGRGVYIFRDALEPELEHLEKFLGKNGVFVDIGANTGVYTMKAAKHYASGGGQVVAVEPFPEMLAALYHNVRENGFSNVRLRNFCVGDRTAATRLWMNFNRPHSFSLNRADESASSWSTLMVSLDDLFAWEGFDRLDYLKIDAEGAEAQILSGGKATIARYRPILQMEVNIRDTALELPEYSAFQARGGVNKLYVPNESAFVRVPETLGWGRADGQALESQ